MLHWNASVSMNLALGGRMQPLCARVHAWPDSAVRTAFLRAMDRVFEPDHCARIRATWLIGDMLRRG